MNPANALNFSGGPGALPASVLEQLAAAMSEVPEVGLSILGISHRSDWFAAIVGELEDNIRQLLGIGSNYHVLLLQGGLEAMAATVYAAIDASDGFYRGRAAVGDRSLMNVAFDLATPELGRRFLAACERLAGCMDDFRRARP